jgi:hypothetical protein
MRQNDSGEAQLAAACRQTIRSKGAAAGKLKKEGSFQCFYHQVKLPSLRLKFLQKTEYNLQTTCKQPARY